MPVDKNNEHIERLRARLISNETEGVGKLEPSDDFLDQIVAKVEKKHTRRYFLIWFLGIPICLVLIFVVFGQNKGIDLHNNILSKCIGKFNEEKADVKNQDYLAEMSEDNDERLFKKESNQIDLIIGNPDSSIVSDKESVIFSKKSTIKNDELLENTINTNVKHRSNNNRLGNTNVFKIENKVLEPNLFSNTEILSARVQKRSRTLMNKLPRLKRELLVSYSFDYQESLVNLNNGIKIYPKIQKRTDRDYYEISIFGGFQKNNYSIDNKKIDSRILFDLTNKTSQRYGIMLSHQIDTKLSLSFGCGFYNSPFSATYDLELSEHETYSFKDRNGETLLKLESEIPSFAGGLNADLNFRSTGVELENDGAIELSLGHTYTTFIFPTLIEYSFLKMNSSKFKIGMGLTYHYRRPSIGTEVEIATIYNDNLLIDNLQFLPVQRTDRPFRTNNFSYDATINYTIPLGGNFNLGICSQASIMHYSLYQDETLGVNSSFWSAGVIISYVL